jgi:hypothetical protein
MTLDAARKPIPPSSPGITLVSNLKQDGFAFDQPEELAMFQTLVARQERMPPHDSLLIARGVVRVPGRTFKPDLLVVYRKRAGIIEIDGATHYSRAAADRSRDHMLEDAGISYVDRICVEEACDPEGREGFVERFIQRLIS